MLTCHHDLLQLLQYLTPKLYISGILIKLIYILWKYCLYNRSVYSPHLKWWRIAFRASPSHQLVVKFSTLTSEYERVHCRTQLSKIFSLLVCCRLDMTSFMMSFTCKWKQRSTQILWTQQKQKNSKHFHIQLIPYVCITYTIWKEIKSH